jgi:membrane protein implicated in regulation of membrane protease activity
MRLLLIVLGLIAVVVGGLGLFAIINLSMQASIVIIVAGLLAIVFSRASWPTP